MLTVAVTPELDHARQLATELQCAGLHAQVGSADGETGRSAGQPAARSYRVQVPAPEVVRAQRLLRRV